MHEQYNDFDAELKGNDFLIIHPECMPFIGEKYKESRLLLIGESHYAPKEEIHCVNRRDYYEIPLEELENGKYKEWINTRKVFEKRVYDKCDFKNFFSNPATEIAKIIHHTNNPTLDQRIEAMHQYAFVNYFKRPSYDAGKTIRGLTEEDYSYAYNITMDIIKVLKPSLIIFMSKKAYRAFCDYNNGGKNISSQYEIEAVSHPSSCWWNRTRKNGGCAKDDFNKYISEKLK